MKGFLEDSGRGSFEAVQEQRVLVDLLERLLGVESEGEVEEKGREATVEKGTAALFWIAASMTIPQGSVPASTIP